MKNRVWLLVAAGIIIGVLPAWGDQGKSVDGNATVLDSVVVTASRIEEKKRDVSTHITVVTEEEIQQASVRDLADLLAQQGFMVRDYPNSTTSVYVRGFRTETHGNDLANQVLILINGRRAGTGNIAKIMMDNVERVEIVRGPGSVQYGASAMGGVINVITKQGEGKPSVYVEGVLSSWDYGKVSAGASGQFNHVDFSFSVSSESQDDYNTAQGDRYLNTGYDSKERISINAGWTFIPKNRIGLTYTGYEGRSIGKPDYLSRNDPDDHIDLGLNSVDVVYDGQTAEGFLLWNLRYFIGKDEYETFDPATSKTHDYFRDTDQRGGQAQMTVSWDWARITTGYDWTYYEVENINSSGENSYDNPALFFLAKTQLLDNKLVLSLGGRHDSYEVNSDDGRSVEETNWSSSLGAIYKFTSQLSARINYAEGFRMPTAEELYMFNDYSAWGYGVWSGNPDLKAEKSHTYEIGLDYTIGTLSSSATYFVSQFEDKIFYVYEPVGDITRYENIEGATIAGIEGTLQVDVGALFEWRYELVPYLSFTHLTDYRDEESDEDLQYTPESSGAYGMRFANHELGLAARLNFAYISRQDIIDYEGTGKKTLDGYSVADLTISKILLPMGQDGNVTIKAHIKNLFDEDFAAVQGYPMPGRSLFVGLKFTY